MWLDVLIVLPAVLMAMALRPWRAVPSSGPPWPWLAWWAVMPLLWGADQVARIPLVQPLSGTCLLVLLLGWPLAMLALLPVALITTLMSHIGWLEGLARLTWLGVVPGTLVMLLGSAIRRWMPHHLFVYILGRGFFAPVVAGSVAGLLAMWANGLPAGTGAEELLIGRWLSAWGDAFLTGMFVAIFVAFRPEWLATYSDRLYLPKA